MYYNGTLLNGCDRSYYKRRENFDLFGKSEVSVVTNVSGNKPLADIKVSSQVEKNTQPIDDLINISDSERANLLKSNQMKTTNESGMVVSEEIQGKSVGENAPADINNPTKIYKISEDNYKANCPVPSGTENTKRYLRDYVLNGRKYCDCLPVEKDHEESTRKEVDNYREKQLEFRDQINGTSMKTDDVVDQMAMINLKGGFNANGQMISDVYDQMTSNTRGQRVGKLDGPGFVSGTSTGSNQCVRSPMLNTSGPIIEANYISEVPKTGMMGGKYYQNYESMYDQDGVSNGNKFYDQIYANDQMFDNMPMIED